MENDKDSRNILEHNVEFLVPGMELARDVYTTDGKVLVSEGTEIHQSHIQKLTNWQVDKVYIFAEVSAPNAIVDPKVQQFLNTYNQSIRVVTKAFDDIRLSQRVPLDTFTATAEDIAEKTASAGNIIDQMYNLPKCDDYTIYHSVNVSAIAATIAMWLGYPAESINSISLAALLHDVGKSQLPETLLSQQGLLSPGEWEFYKKHTYYGSQLVEKIPNVAKSLLAAVLEHHERVDGSGYPNGLTGDEIHPYAKIIAIADLYDEALTLNREEPRLLSPYASLERLRENIDKVDAKICLTFITKMTSFLSGNRVALSDGREGLVVCVNKAFPARSMVQMPDGGVLDLAEEPGVRIHHIIR